MISLPQPDVILTHESDLDGLVAGVLLRRLARKRGLNPDHVWGGLVLAVVMGILGARAGIGRRRTRSFRATALQWRPLRRRFRPPRRRLRPHRGFLDSGCGKTPSGDDAVRPAAWT